MLQLNRSLGFALCSIALADGGVPSPIEKGAAIRCFSEAQGLSNRDGRKLWGKCLYGPMMFVDPNSRFAIANGPDAKGALHPSGGVWEGYLPEGVRFANTAMEWSGVHWTMVNWPLPEEGHLRQKLMMHECFHRIQKSLALEVKDHSCGHLDTKEGRIWLQLEWRALAEALVTQGPLRRRAIQDALLFRTHRRSIFPEAATIEQDMELNEGLAEYTGIRSSARSEAQTLIDALVALEAGARKPTFVRSFAYASGPVYGLLLDASTSTWRNQLKGHPDLGELLRKALAIRVLPRGEASAIKHATKYGLLELTQDEASRDEERKSKVAHFRSQLVEGSVLILPRTRDFNYSFDPNNVVPLGELGLVYPTIQGTDFWGTVDVSRGALMTAVDLRVPAPENLDARPLKGAGWSMDLAPGWNLLPDSRTGDYRLVQESGKPTPRDSANTPK